MTTSTLITGVDFVCVPTRDHDRAIEFYGETLGLERRKRWGDMPATEFQAGNLTLAVMDPSAFGQPDAHPNSAPIALQVEDVGAARDALKDKGRRVRARGAGLGRLSPGDLPRPGRQPAHPPPSLRARAGRVRRYATGASGPQARMSCASSAARSSLQRPVATRCSASASTSSSVARASSSVAAKISVSAASRIALLLGLVQLGRADVLEGADDAAVGLGALAVHISLIVRIRPGLTESVTLGTRGGRVVERR